MPAAVEGFSAAGALALLAWVLMFAGCAPVGDAYAAYDTHFERELVAGHDSQRGDYVEYRVKPRRGESRVERRGLGSTLDPLPSTSSGKEVLR